jgi:hypothetical protein
MMDTDRQARLHNQQRLRQLVAESGKTVTVFCSHDPRELQQALGAGINGQ